jgi:hypothetical protein
MHLILPSLLSLVLCCNWCRLAVVKQLNEFNITELLPLLLLLLLLTQDKAVHNTPMEVQRGQDV